MMTNPTNEAFTSAVNRAVQALSLGRVGRFHVAVIPAGVEYEARLIDFSQSMEIVDKEFHKDPRTAALLAKNAAPEDAGLVVAFILRANTEGWEWDHLSIIDKKDLPIAEKFVRIL